MHCIQYGSQAVSWIGGEELAEGRHARDFCNVLAGRVSPEEKCLLDVFVEGNVIHNYEDSRENSPEF